MFFSLALIIPALTLVSAFLLPLSGTGGVFIFYAGIVLGILSGCLGLFWVSPFSKTLYLKTLTFTQQVKQGAFLMLSASLYLMLGMGIYIFQGTFPALNDLSTDLINPPQFYKIADFEEYKGKELLYPQKFKTLAEKYYPKFEGKVLALSSEKSFELLLQILKAESQGWEIVSAIPEQGIIEAVNTEKWFSFKEDLVIRITPQGALESKVDMRSRSRYQERDHGTNFRLISGLLLQLEKYQIKSQVPAQKK
jgi:uncharacterized protein (DUF1499 family)